MVCHYQDFMNINSRNGLVLASARMSDSIIACANILDLFLLVQ